MYTEHFVWIDQPDTGLQQEGLDILIGKGWRVFATHAVIDKVGDMAVVYVLIQDVELDDDDE